MDRAFTEARKGLQHKNDVAKNILPVSDDMRETFKIRVESPEVVILKIQTSGCIKLSLLRSGAFTAHVQGTVSHVRVVESSEEVLYQRSYRSDKGGYENSFNVTSGDVISIMMEAHHFVSAVVGQGSSEMELNITY
jgi:hypothetical protein